MSFTTEQLRRGILALCGLAGALVSSVMAAGALTHPGGLWCLFWVLVLCAAASVILTRRPLFHAQRHTLSAILGLYLCLCLRLTLFDYISPDYVSFLGPWTAEMRTMTIREALNTPIGDYNMPYLYILLVISRLGLYDVYCIKLVSVLADVFLALAVGRLAQLLTKRDGLIFAAFLGTLLAPTVFLNSGYWGQCDGVYACFGLWGLYCGLKKRSIPAMVLFACSFAFKLQAIFLLPVAVFLLVQRRVRLPDLLAFPGTFLVIMLPALLAGRSFSDTFGIYLSQTEAYPYLSLNAPSFWSLVPNEYFDHVGTAAVLLAGIVVLALLYGFLLRSQRFSTGDLITLSLIFSLAIPWLLPRMHERYFFLAEVLSILYAVRYPRRLAVTVTQLTAGFLAYCSYLFGGMRILSNALVAAVLGLELLYLIVQFIRDTDAPGAHHINSNKEEPQHENGLPLA